MALHSKSEAMRSGALGSHVRRSHTRSHTQAVHTCTHCQHRRQGHALHHPSIAASALRTFSQAMKKGVAPFGVVAEVTSAFHREASASRSTFTLLSLQASNVRRIHCACDAISCMRVDCRAP